MHPNLLSSYSIMMPRLQAAESIRRAQIVGVGTGSMKRDDMWRLLRQWSRDADPSDAKRIKPKPEGLGAVMATVGVEFVKVPAAKDGDRV